MNLFRSVKHKFVDRGEAQPGRDMPLVVDDMHYVNGRSIKPPFPVEYEQALFALGCFWGSATTVLYRFAYLNCYEYLFRKICISFCVAHVNQMYQTQLSN